MSQTLGPRELLLNAGTLRGVAASMVLLAAGTAGAQSGNPDSGAAVEPWKQKVAPQVAEATTKRADAAMAQPGAPASPAPAPKADGANKERKNAEAEKDSKASVKVSEHNTVDLHVKDESITSVLELLSIQSQKNIIASKNVEGKVKADLFGVTFYEALDAVLHVNGFQYVEKGNFIYVYTREEYTEIQKALSKRVAKVMRLNYLNAIDAESFVKPLLSQGGDIKTATKTAEFQISADAPAGKDDYALGAVLVVIDFEENIAAIEKLLTEIDTRPAQVLVEATILETQVIEKNAFGIDFSIIGDLNFTDFVSVGGPLGVAQAIIRGGNGTANGLSPADSRGGALSTSAGGTATGASTVKIGVVAGPIGVFLRALDDVSDFTVISSPKLLALNRMPSRVLVGQRVGYLNTTATETSTTQTVQFLDTGTTLYFRPFVSNSGEIRMELKPKVASATIRDAGNGQGGIVSIPDETTQEITTNVIVKDGSTIVLGGLFVERTNSFRKQVPIFGDIPLIGEAFRGHDDSTDRRELIFLIRPQIVGETALAMQGIDIKNEIENIRAGQRQGLLPFSREKMTATLNVEAEAAAREGKSEEALWKIQRSLSLNPRQPDAIRLRERITSEQERWPTNFLLDGVVNGEISKQMDQVPPAPGSKHLVPQGSVDLPRKSVPSKSRSDAGESIFDRTLQNALEATGNPVQPDANSNTTPATEPQGTPGGEATTSAEGQTSSASPSGDSMGLGSDDASGFAAGTSMTAQGEGEQAASSFSTGEPMGEQPVASNPEAAANTSQPVQSQTPSAEQPAAKQQLSSKVPSPTLPLVTPVEPNTAGAAQRRATRMSAKSFFQAIFLGPAKQPESTITGAPSDAPQQQQELSK